MDFNYSFRILAGTYDAFEQHAFSPLAIFSLQHLCIAVSSLILQSDLSPLLHFSQVAQDSVFAFTQHPSSEVEVAVPQLIIKTVAATAKNLITFFMSNDH
ncbi:hypothetical protein NH26_01655 [Flammeovirga pacifica]|uniref:Uncharacterized protein n=1 Tax=Flammeovirga pacifica TaxID=915059 RepID=A0A1S1YVT9_FLAPC|nr:hypothetical protein NH26_01655 [Flammeovirga pacifica]